MIYILSMLFLLFTPAKKYDLELQLKKGDVYYQNMTSTSHMKQSFQGVDQIVDMESSTSAKFEVASVADNNYKFDVSFEWLEMSIKSGLMNQSFSSKDTGKEANIISLVLGEMTKSSFIVTMTPKGKVIDVSGIDELYDSALSQFPEMNEMQKQQVRNQMSQAYGKEAIKGNIEQLSAIFPNKKVSVNDTWTSTIELKSGMEGTQEATFKLAEITDEFVRIEMTSRIFTEDKTAYVQIGGNDARYLISGDGTANLRLDRASMWIVDGSINQEMSGTIEIEPNDDMPDGMKIPVEFEIESIIKDR